MRIDRDRTERVYGGYARVYDPRIVECVNARKESGARAAGQGAP